ncbi:MAG: Hsp20/alpha crystallin family protein [Hyphomicrobiaceae bacterium]|nr:Hsp20/alpha crystallin family protein [Hyphomicrobiaceae bacterium]
MSENSLPKPVPQVSVPRNVFDAMRHEMSRIFGTLDLRSQDWPAFIASGTGANALQLDVRETDNAFIIEAELPGVDEKDVSVTYINGVLSVKAEKKSEQEQKDQNYYVSERTYGRFERSIRLPDSVDDSKIDARIDKGVLKITATKRSDAKSAERKIEIKKA